MSESIKPQRQGKEKQEDFIVVEIGSASVPLLQSAVLTSELHAGLYGNYPNMKYFAVDINENELKDGKTETSIVERIGRLQEGQLHYVKAKGEQLPFANHSVSQVIMKDVAGAAYLPGNSRHQMVLEAARVLKPGGLLKIFETYTPRASEDIIKYIQQDLTNVFEEPDTGDIALFNEDFLDNELLKQIPSSRVFESYDDKLVRRFRRKSLD